MLNAVMLRLIDFVDPNDLMITLITLLLKFKRAEQNKAV
jgi:hypothetical protein